MVGIYPKPDGPHEGNRSPCQLTYGGLCRCKQLTRASDNSHEPNRAKKTKYLPSGSGMGFDTSTFNMSSINELDNTAINSRMGDLAVGRSAKHDRHDHVGCAEVWICERCFCNSPLTRWLDKLDEVCVARPSDEQDI